MGRPNMLPIRACCFPDSSFTNRLTPVLVNKARSVTGNSTTPASTRFGVVFDPMLLDESAIKPVDAQPVNKKADRSAVAIVLKNIILPEIKNACFKQCPNVTLRL